MKRLFEVFGLCTLAFIPVSALAQTLSLNDGSIVQSSTNRMGVNIGAIEYYDNGQILKNLIGSLNPGFEPLQNRQIWSLAAAGSTTTFTIPDQYDGVPPNYWAGGTFTVVESQSGGAELGCTGTIASNTGPNFPLVGQSTYTAPGITVSSPCDAPFSVGDIVVMSLTTFPTPESWWETSEGGFWGAVRGGAQLLSDTTDLCATCGVQALNMNAATPGSLATANWYFDSSFTEDIFVMMNGTYELSFWAKLASGDPVLTATARRLSPGGFNCGSYTPTLTSTWTKYTWTCSTSETATGTTPGNIQVGINTTGGAVYLDNVSFEKTGTNPGNTTVLRDEVIQTLQNYYGPSVGNNPGTFRYWVNQNGETMNNWTQPDYAHAPSSGGAGYSVAPSGAGVVSLSLEDYLVICQLLNAEPYLEVPVTFSTSDAADLIEFLASPSTTTYGARRAALGQGNPWTSIFNTIHLSFCNECWNNTAFSGQSLADRITQPNSEYYYDYSTRARDIFAAMRADSYYSSPSFDFVMNAQTATNWSMDTAIARAHPDSIEIEAYTYNTVNSFASDTALWQPTMVEPYEKVTNPSDVYHFYQSVHDYQSQNTCGATGTATCKVNIYEWGQGTTAGSIDQTHLDYINAGAGEGVIMALQPLLFLQYYGIRPQNFFALTENTNKALNGLTNKLWGNVVDMGGATNNVRPEFLGVQLVNQSIIGPMYACPIANNLTYNFAGSPNGVSPLPALNNVPYLYAFCFENGTNRSLVLINTDLSSSHTISFGGTNPPTGAVTQRQYSPGALDDMNESPTNTLTNLTAATVAINTTSLSSPASVTLPPFSVTALDYATTGQGLVTSSPSAAMPILSLPSGSYASSQIVTISDSTPGATIYYTTNGSTPATSSPVYSGPITVSATQTLQAIAIEAGYTNSPVATAVYTIASTALPTLPAPAFSPAGGTYSTSQTVTLGDAPGTTIFYTTNGSTPTTSSTVYSGPIAVSATQTLEAIAVETGYSNSPVSTASYAINGNTLPAPTFSPAAGTYSNSQTVTISDAAAGTTIYYATFSATTAPLWKAYSGPITVNATETVQAVATETGIIQSPMAAATYIIDGAPTPPATLPAPTFSPAPGTYATSQTVTIGDATAGTTIFYTINGGTAPTSWSVYSGPITVSATETVEAVATEKGLAQSAMATAAYNIESATALPSPTFSPAPGTYTTSQTVTISDATPGTTIFYAINSGTSPTSWSLYSGPITVNATERVEAVATETGLTQSAMATADYAISSDFSISLSPSSLIFASGESAASMVKINPVSGSNQTVTLGCAGLPAFLTCRFSPSSVTPGNTPATSMLIVTANTNTASGRGMPPFVPITAVGFLFFAIGFRRRSKLFSGLLVIGVALGLTALNGCGGIQGPIPSASTITVTATVGTIQRTAPLAITVN